MNGIAADLDGSILRVVLNRPDKLNAVNTTMLREIESTLQGARAQGARVVVLTGAGRAFCAGGDLGGADTSGAAEAANDVVTAIIELPLPVVAGVNGPACGFGCALALACDVTVMAPQAYFQLAFAHVGLMPDGGATTLLYAAIGRARTLRMAMFAEKITAQQAAKWGMVTHLTREDGYDDELKTVVHQLACGPTQSYKWIKAALATAALGDLARVQALETQGQYTLARTNDFRAGVSAFHSRSAPIFEGR